jgi:peptide/nickel transport system substrate-binding protein
MRPSGLRHAFRLLASLAVSVVAACAPAAPQQAPPTSAPVVAAPTSAPAPVAPAAAQKPTAAAAPVPTSQPAAATDKPLVILQGVDANTLDPYFITQRTDDNILQSIFTPLTTWDQDMKPAPSMATSWKAIDDTTWEFKIRDNVKASSGAPMDAADVVYSFERAVDPAVKAVGNVPWVLGNINFDKAEAVDKTTVRIHSKKPAPDAPIFLGEFLIVPKDYYSKTPLADLALKPVGSGPYQLVSWRKGESLTLQPNPNYWGAAPDFKNVIWRPVSEEASRIAELNTGGADIIVNVSPDLKGTLDSSAGRLSTVQGLRRIYIGFVFYANPAVQDVRVRRAFNYGIDFQKIIDGLLGGNGKRTGTFANPPNEDPSSKPFPFDPAKAKALLQDAGYGTGGKPLQLTLQTPKGRYIKDFEIAQAVAAELKNNLGVDINVAPTEWATLNQQTSKSQLTGDMFLLGSGAGFTCDGDLSDFYTDSGWEPGKWRNAEFDAASTQLISTTDPTQRQQLCYKLQQIMSDQLPLMFLYDQVDYYGVSKRTNWTPLPDEFILPATAKRAQ